LTLISGPDEEDSTSARRPPTTWVPGKGTAGTVEGMRLGVPENFFFEDIRVDVGAVVNDAVQRLGALGATLVTMPLPLVVHPVNPATLSVVIVK
ncbi:MAG: hypothetical protein ACRDIE_10795, partial [Chloroflexota bacterium]